METFTWIVDKIVLILLITTSINLFALLICCVSEHLIPDSYKLPEEVKINAIKQCKSSLFVIYLGCTILYIV